MRRFVVLLMCVSIAVPSAGAAEVRSERLSTREHDELRSLYRLGVSELVIGTRKGASGPLREGPVQLKYADGRLALSGSFKDGKPHGTWRRWYPSGKLFSTTQYENGLAQGAARTYFESGRLAQLWHYRYGRPDGLSELWEENGTLSARRYFRSGELISSTIDRAALWNGRIPLELRRQRPADGLRFEVYCKVYDTGSFRCKTVDQIRHDLSTIADPAAVEELLAKLDALYGELGLNSDKNVLNECSDTFTASKDLRATGGAIVQEPSAHRAGINEDTAVGIRDACRKATLDGLGRRGGNEDLRADAQYRQWVVGVVNSMDEQIDQCRNEEFPKPSVEFAGPLIGAIAVIIGAYIAYRAATDSAEITDDGYENGVKLGPNRTAYSADHMQEVRSGRYTEQWIYDDAGKVEMYRLFTPNGGREVEVADGNIVRERSCTSDWVCGSWDTSRAGQPAAPPPKGTPPPRNPPKDAKLPEDKSASKGGSTSRPAPDSQPRNCEAAQQWWSFVKERCEQSGWQTYDCQQVLRQRSNCVDTALILPGPDGDLTCPPRRAAPTIVTMREDVCKRRGSIERTLQGSHPCGFTDIERPASDRAASICADPRAMCLPDMLVPSAGALR